ncbi:TlpA family protein disulfide reductase [Helcobacillus sp. ACRRO]|uniref:TlpA family protein disulfide reductase n=1 Tax=Helcobacillus sp. ACRRO TaxID=2918202 RepID=UPI001EF5F57D|nr:TlpA disulfide reductase family protein [Helcobacillus sp. ACRRO]MCG7427977.1 TlpA family protein disulfide reductase [Helcobacillus sp. ACRRO]
MTNPTLSRRHLVGALGALTTTAVFAACGTDTNSRYDTGFVAGDGVTTEIDPADRGDAVDFTATAYDGTDIALADWRGKPVVLNVWYASCAPCRKEAPDLKAIAGDYGEKIHMLGINVRDGAGTAKAFEENFAIPYPSVPDLDAQIMYKLRGQVSPNAVPSTLVLDDEGRVAARISGIADPSILRAMIDRVLSE